MHIHWQLVAGGAVVAISLALQAIVRNPLVRRRLRLTVWITLAYLALHLAGTEIAAVRQFDSNGNIAVGEKILLLLALCNAGVSLLNPWFREGTFDRLPSILQDALVVVVFATIATFMFPNEHVIVTSTVAAAVLGFALQDTLGNGFAGLAIQVDRPFQLGHWIQVNTYEGMVVEITWRATKLRTKAGNLVVLPNNIVSKEAITNYSAPVAPTRLFVDVGATYLIAPNVVREAILSAMHRAPGVLAMPQPDVLVHDFGASAIIYRARFWIIDFAQTEIVCDQVRTSIYYEFHRRHIEIPWPIQVQIDRTETPQDPAIRRDAHAKVIAGVPVLSALVPDAHRALADRAARHLYAKGEVIVKEGDPGASMFVVESGRVAITVEPGQRQVAVTEAGGYFGEMSLLTGAPRAATVTALEDCTVLEISADVFRESALTHSGVLEQVALAASTRQRELTTARASASAPADAPASLLARMRKFFGMGGA